MKIAYFSMEIGLNENIPTYSGGLGILAGDHIKSAADLNVPLIAVTLLYKRGYFIQNINPFGQQEENYPYFDARAFMEPLPFKVTIKIEGRNRGTSASGSTTRSAPAVVYPSISSIRISNRTPRKTGSSLSISTAATSTPGSVRKRSWGSAGISSSNGWSEA